MQTPVLSDAEFTLLRDRVQTEAGINVSAAKKPLVTSRLLKRSTPLGLHGFGEYYRLVADGDARETQMALDLLATNETTFFREPKHFTVLRSGGYFFGGHSGSLHGLDVTLDAVLPAIYRRV